MGRPDFRIGDAKADDAMARLRDHYAAGRIDKEEFDERSDAVWSARTEGDLAVIFADLAPPRRSAAGTRRSRGGWVAPGGWRGPLPLLPVLFVLIVLTALTHVPFVLLAFVGCFFVVG